MTIKINCTVEELKEKAAVLQNASQSETIDHVFWLKELVPKKDTIATNHSAPYDHLPEEEKIKKFKEWFAIYKNEYKNLRSNVLENILDSYLLNNPDEKTFAEIRESLLNYLVNDTGPIAYKSGLILEKNELEKLISESIIEIDDTTDEQQITKLFSYLNGFNYEEDLSEETVKRLVNLIQQACSRDYTSSNPYFKLFNIFDKLAPKYPKELAALQEILADTLNLNAISYDEYEPAIYFVSNTWEHISLYWSEDSKRKLIDNTIALLEEEFEPGDAFGEDTVLRALKLIGKDDETAQIVIAKCEKELEEYYENEEDEEDEDDEE